MRREGSFLFGGASEFPGAVSDPDLAHVYDDKLNRLLDGAVKGTVPVYFAAMPLGLCVPFALKDVPEALGL